VLLLCAGYLVLLVSWAQSNPPFAAPDEPDHYLRAIAVAGGAVRASEEVRVPAGLWSEQVLACNKHQPTRTARCLDAVRPTATRVGADSRAGNYPPVFYALPGFAVRASSTPTSANVTARLVVALTSAFVLAAAALLLWDARARLVSVIGLVVAVTPMVMFVSATLSSSALEVSAGIAFLASLVRLTRGPTLTLAWAATATFGSLLILSRSAGVLWAALGAILIVALVGIGTASNLARSSRRAAQFTAGALVAAAAANRLWEHAYGSDVTQVGPLSTPWYSRIPEAVGEFGRLASEWVGVFGWLDSYMPVSAHLAWFLMIAAIAALALTLGETRERLTLVAAMVLSVVLAIVVSATFASGDFGGGAQARHFLPVLVSIPLLSGEVVDRNRDRIARPTILAVTTITVIAAIIHAVALYANARRHAVGADGPWLFASSAEWTPPLGWGATFGLAALGAGLLTSAAVSAGTSLPASTRRTSRIP
jgi:hypothetical protein